MSDNPQTFQFAATDDEVRLALASVRTCFRDDGIGDGLCDKAEVVLAEILNNVVEHATAGQADGKVWLSTRYRDPVLECELCDNGIAMPDHTLPDGTPPKIGDRIEDLPEGGFGWHLIRAMVHNLDYRRDAGRNCLRFSMSE